MSVSPHSSPQDERRQTPRVDVTGRLDSRLEPNTQPVTIRDLSLGGFLIESDEPFPTDAIHQFRVATPAGWTTMLTARSVHSRKRAGNGYLTGFAFLEPKGQEAQQRIVELIDQVTSVVTFDETQASPERETRGDAS
jgi:hypothetical protein